MKRFPVYLITALITIGAIMAFNIRNDHSTAEHPADDLSIDIPEDVNAVLNEYCYGCHNSESKNEKGRDKLSIDNLDELSTGKLAAKLNKIAKEVEAGDMPPEKFLAKYPDKEPSKKDKKTVVKWAKAAAKEL